MAKGIAPSVEKLIRGALVFGAGGIGQRVVLVADGAAQLFKDFVRHLLKYRDNIRIKLAAAASLNFGASSLHCLPRPVYAVGGDSVECVSNGKDPRPQRYFLALQTTWVSRAIEAFLMGVDNLGGFPQDRDLLHQLVTEITMLTHNSEFVRRELSWLVQDIVGNR